MPHNQGIALISVLFVAVAVIILSSTFSYAVLSERDSATNAQLLNETLQVADAATERARVQAVEAFRGSYLTVDNFLAEVRADTIDELKGVHSVDIGGFEGRWTVVGVSAADSQHKWLDVRATAETERGAQTVTRRIGFGTSAIFELAMLSERTDCMYCHLRVNGDVGQFYEMRPGWGTEGEDGIGSGGHNGGSTIGGNVYLARGVTGDDTNLAAGDTKVNGATIEGTVSMNYKGDKLPPDIDDDGIPDFPAINREVAERNANGSISGGEVLYTGTGVQTAVPSSSSSIASKNTGNAILIGTEDNPIDLSGDVYFSGDVIIKGVVKGRGAIYAGRNIYVAGNISYKNEADNCWKQAEPDQCAQQAIQAGKDELRLGARGNIIVGDYTEQDKDGNSKLWYAQQAADFYKSQFDLHGSKVFEKGTGDELKCEVDICRNADGDVVSSGNYVTRTGADAYAYTLRPGSVDASGNFEAWLSDGLYQEILGTETRKYDTWRKDVDRSSLTQETLETQFAAFNLSQQSIDDILCADASSPCSTRFDISNTAGQTIGRVDINSDRLKVIIDEAHSYEKQVTHVDAFLYANQRIAGKTFNAPLAINGGLIAKDIGILAPGITKHGWWDSADGRYNFIRDLDCSDLPSAKTFSAHPEAEGVYEPDSEDCALTVNYDYRLRNGGFGFSLVANDVGQTIGWQLGSTLDGRVQ